MTDITLTRHESAFVQKLASYFKVPQKALREKLNVQDHEQGLISFSDPFEDMPFPARFAVHAGSFNLGQVLDADRFKKSPLFEQYEFFKTKYQGSVVCFVLYQGASSVWVVEAQPRNTALVSPTGRVVVGYDYLKHNSEGMQLVFFPLKNWLKSYYPSPLSD